MAGSPLSWGVGVGVLGLLYLNCLVAVSAYDVWKVFSDDNLSIISPPHHHDRLCWLWFMEFCWICIPSASPDRQHFPADPLKMQSFCFVAHPASIWLAKFVHFVIKHVPVSKFCVLWWNRKEPVSKNTSFGRSETNNIPDPHQAS